MEKLSKHSITRINEIIDKYNNEKTPLMIILEEIQSEFGYVSLPVQELVASKLNLSLSEVYGVVSFYSFFSLVPKGKYIIGICLGTACYIKGSNDVVEKFCSLLDIKPGQTTKDGLFTIDTLRCIGACGIAPALSINSQVYPKVSLNDIQGIINSYKEREEAANE
jgi:NADH:ubiquinone oxidoreductase subunit E